jgi:RNA-directed DNA polymerase
VNTDAPPQTLWPTFGQAERRVQEIQTKLHRWASDDRHRRFDDLYNLVADPAFLLMGWIRVRENRGARTAGVDGTTAHYIEDVRGVEGFLGDLRKDLKARTFTPLPARERMIPKPGGEKRRLGIPTVRDRVVQAALKLVLEPIFETDFHPCSYGFRPNRRAHDAIAETRYLTSRGYEWVVEGDIKACFDEISHSALMDRVRARIADKRVLTLVKAFLKAGILSQDGALRHADTGTPQGGVLSPLLANIALTVLDEYVAEHRGGPGSTSNERARRRRHGQPNCRIIRYADDFLVVIDGTREHAEEIREELAEVLAPMGLQLSEEKTLITHIDEGLDFLGWRIQRHRKRGVDRQYVYTYPARKAVRAVIDKVKTLCRRYINQPLSLLLRRLNSTLHGWCMYFRYGVSSRAFQILNRASWRRVMWWARRKHARISWREISRRFCAGGWTPTDGTVTLFLPSSVRTLRYRYRGAQIPTPWTAAA